MSPNTCVFAVLLLGAALSSVVAGAVPFADDDDRPDVLVVTNRAMGVEFQITLVTQQRTAEAALALARDAHREVSRLEAVLNNWSVTSDISELNATPGTGWLDIDVDLACVLAAACSMHARTDGAYDPTVLPLVAAWGLVDREAATPTADELDAIGARVGCEHLQVRLDPPGVRRDIEGLELDVSSLAKGWAVDRVMERLRDAGVTTAFVAAGASTVAALGAGVDGEGWPFEVAPGVTWKLRDQAVSTSGRSDAGIPGGAVLEHILDPRTGAPAARAVRRAVFVGPSATEADMGSTALVVLGADGAREWFAREGLGSDHGALLLLDDGEPVALGLAATLGRQTALRASASQTTVRPDR